MHLKWLEDVLAVAKAPSLTEAARARCVTQPAFSRRLRALEEWLDVDLIDRSCRNGRLTPAARVHLPRIESLASDFERLRRDIVQWNRAEGRLVIVAQHSLATTILPRLVLRLGHEQTIADLKVSAADRDVCERMLNEGEADIQIAYQTRTGADASDTDALCLRLARDELIAVAAPSVAVALTRDERVDVVAYPSSVFFGGVLHRDVLASIQTTRGLRIRCETALASGVMELVLAELGVGWLPRLLAAHNIASGRLVDVTQILGGVALDIVATRKRRSANPLMSSAWSTLQGIDLSREHPVVSRLRKQ